VMHRNGIENDFRCVYGMVCAETRMLSVRSLSVPAERESESHIFDKKLSTKSLTITNKKH